MEAHPNLTPYKGHRSQAHIAKLKAVAHLLKQIIQADMESGDSLRIVHDCFPWNRMRNHALSDNGCELVKARQIWYKEYLYHPLFFNVDHLPSEMGQGKNTIGFITMFNFPKQQLDKRQSHYVR
jgi:hypothetical protein